MPSRRALIGGALAWVLAASPAAPPAGSPGDPAGDAALRARVEGVLREAPLVDGHNDLVRHFHACGEECPRGVGDYDISEGAPGHTDIARWRQGGVGAQLLNAGYSDNEAPTLEGTLAGLSFARSLLARYPRDLVVARDGADVNRARQSGRIAVLLALEHPGRLGSDEATVRRLAREGVRANILAYDGPSALADGHAGPAAHGGLSPLGRDMVGWMQGAGMLVDLSHASAATMRDVLDIATAPVLFSHSNAAALADVPRNVPDDVLRRLPANGGIVMVSFAPYFASKPFAEWMARGDAYWEASGHSAGLMERWERDNPPPAVGIADIADHIEHVRDIAGVDHVGIGGDFDGIAFTVQGLEDVSTYPRLFEELARRGWNDTDLAKLAGRNFLRVLEAADTRSRRAGQ